MMTFSESLSLARERIASAEAVLIGAGAGLSTAAGLQYGGERFLRLFPEYAKKYGLKDMYSAGFYPFETREEYWAYWSRHVWVNRYEFTPGSVYATLLGLLKEKNYFVITTNVDHAFQKAGFQKERLFYTQGDYGLIQCAQPCHQKTYDNFEIVKAMVEQQHDMRVPTKLIPHCPVCGGEMTMNLRIDERFVQDDGWYKGRECYAQFLEETKDTSLVFLELGVGFNTPGIIKYPFWQLCFERKKNTLISLNLETTEVPREIRDRTILLEGNIGEGLRALSA